MENSATPDYVTEKLFQAFEAGSVPIAWGASNVHYFEPGENSMLAITDFDSVADAAKRIVALANNETEYRKYLNWKRDGISDHFKALVDLNAVHPQCRMCIKIADQYPGSDLLTHRQPRGDEVMIFVRERGMFYFRAVYLSGEPSLQGLHAAIMDAFRDYTPVWAKQRPQCYLNVFRIYRVVPSYQTVRESLTGLSAITRDDQVGRLRQRSRLDAIFLEERNGLC
jgi:hypothetical protein